VDIPSWRGNQTGATQEVMQTSQTESKSKQGQKQNEQLHSASLCPGIDVAKQIEHNRAGQCQKHDAGETK